MDSLKEQWNFEMALAVLQNETVDGKLWSEAAEWMMVFGPPAMQELLRQASSLATQAHYPELTPRDYTADGEPCYSIAEVAKSLGISEEEALAKMAELEERHGVRHLYTPPEAKKIQ